MKKILEYFNGLLCNCLSYIARPFVLNEGNSHFTNRISSLIIVMENEEEELEHKEHENLALNLNISTATINTTLSLVKDENPILCDSIPTFDDLQITSN